jgi:hypothetical protein
MAKYDDTILIDSQNNAWKGMMAYFKSNGTDTDYMGRADHWGGCTPDTPNTRCDVGDYKEDTVSYFGAEKMIIYEPCNYASNLAYYHSTTRVCDYPNWSVDDVQINALKRSFATLAMGSAMWHGSHTYVGYSFDNNMIAVISYLAHQASVSGLPGSSSILKELSPTPRSKSGVQVSEDLVLMFTNEPVTQWAEILDKADLPHDYFITFAAIISTVFSLVMPWFLVEFSITQLANLLIPKDDAAFIINQYLPELKNAVKNVKVSTEDQTALVYMFGGMLMKIGYAFLWQEFFIPLPSLYGPLPNQLGAWAMPYWNGASAKISGIPQTDAAVNNAVKVYPGDQKCRGTSPHALWHEESANGLLEIAFVSDFAHRILNKKIEDIIQ